MKTLQLAIDFGSTNTIIYKMGSGIVLKEPTAVFLQIVNKDYIIKEVGLKAKKMLGRTDENSAVVYPIVEGVIKNKDFATKLLKEFLIKVTGKKYFRPKTSVLLVLPCGLSTEEVFSYKEVLHSAGVNKIKIVPNILTSYLGDDSISFADRSVMAVNIGGGNTEIAIIANNTIINGCSLSVGGRSIDNAIREIIETKNNTKISQNISEKIKNEIGSLYESDNSNIEFIGIDNELNQPKSYVVSAGELLPAVKETIDAIIKTIKTLLSACSPDILADISSNGIFLSGSVSNLTGLEKYLSSATQLKITISSHADNASILGAGKLMNNYKLLSEIIDKN